jgi:hypothetical protein
MEEIMSVLKISLATAVALTAMAATTSPTKAAPLPTSVGTFKSMSANNVTEVRWVGGWRGGGLGYRGVGWRGGGWGYRGGGWGYRPWGALAAGAVVGGALASGAYYGGGYYGGYPYYDSYAGYGYGGGGGCTCPY